MTIAEIIQKLKAAQDAISQFKQQYDALVAGFDAGQQPADPVVTGDSPTEKVPAVQLPPPQTFSGEHSA